MLRAVSSPDPRHERADRAWALALFLAALSLRLIHLLTVRDSPFFSILYIDPLWYDEWAQRIAAGQWLSERPFFLDPLYPYMLAVIYASCGHSYEAVVAFQGLLGALVAPLVLFAARPWFPRHAARLAGVIAAVYLPAIFFDGLIMKTGLGLFLAALTLGLFSRALAGGRVGVWLAAGIALGLTCLTRGNLILLVPVLALWIVTRADEGKTLRSRLALRSRWFEATGFVAGTSLVLALPLAHNFAVGGELIVTTANGGSNFYIGNNPSNHTGEYQQLPFVNANPKYEQRDFAAEAERRAGRALTDRESSSFWFGESWKWIRAQPLDWLRLCWRKVRAFWGAFEIPDSLDYYLYRETAPVLRLPLPGFGLLAPLGLLGAAWTWRRRGWPRLLVIFVLGYSLSTILFFVFSRFRMVIAPALYVFAAHAALELARRWRVAAGGRTALTAALWPTVGLVALLAFVNVPVRARTDTWSYRLATLAHLPVQPETSALGVFNLGAAYAGRAKEEQDSPRLLVLAETQLRRALALQGPPEHARIHVELGKVLARQQRNREAIELYETAATIEPNDYRIHHTLGLLYRREGDLERAAAAFARSLNVEPRHAASATRLGEMLLQAGRPAEAERAFRRALELAPGDRAAQDGLRSIGAPP